MNGGEAGEKNAQHAGGIDVLLPRQNELLLKVLSLWRRGFQKPDTTYRSNKDTPSSTPKFSSPSLKISTSLSVLPLRKNPLVTKSGNVYIPDAAHSQWLLRHVELRPPFLHLHALPERDEVGVVLLTGSRIDHQPRVGELLRREVKARPQLHAWALYAEHGGGLVVFAAGSEKEKTEWIFYMSVGD